ncbi:MAG TPA: hypothetical protein PKH77_06270 [Anaerolineae bacterium]|nr:hypothetical protein [Anaerolineae bacterium]
MLDELIQILKSRLLEANSLEIFCYYFVNKEQDKIKQTDESQFTGEVERIAVFSFSEEYADRIELEKVAKKLGNPIYKKYLSIYHFIGLSLQDRLSNTRIFEEYLKECFNNQSVRYKYLITKVFNQFEDQIKKHLCAQVETQDSFTLVLKYLYLESNINKNSIISDFEKRSQCLDIIDLMLLEDLRDIQSTGYNKLQMQLFDDILWCATEIQSKYKVLNNNEDQFNSFFQSLLTAKGYKVQDQTQRGTSYSGAQYGELDIAIFTQNDIPLSIFEAFIISSIDKGYITKHLKKLSENYDPTGLRNNYAVIYSRNREFSCLWENYKKFVPTVNFEYKTLTNQFEDISSRFPQFAGIRIGLMKHQNRGMIVQVYHIFMDMNL